MGLTLIYGVMKILNVAHGSLYALGAYVAATLVGAWFGAGLNRRWQSSRCCGLAAVVGGIVAGPLIERGLLRFMYGRDEVVPGPRHLCGVPDPRRRDQAGMGRRSVFCVSSRTVCSAISMSAVLPYPVYDAVAGRCRGPRRRRTDLRVHAHAPGKLLLAVIHDREISAAMGINVEPRLSGHVHVGAMLAALGGAFTAPTVSVRARRSAWRSSCSRSRWW